MVTGTEQSPLNCACTVISLYRQNKEKKIMFKRTVVALIALVFVLSGCSPSAMPTPYSGKNYADQAPAASSSGEYDYTEGSVDEAGRNDTGGKQASEPRRIVIQNASLTITVENPAAAMQSINTMADQMGGFIVSSNFYKRISSTQEEIPEGKITVRVPSGRLNDALNQIKGLTADPAKDVDNESISGQDVTKEYTDLRSRERNLMETETQLREIMKSATKTDDVLKIHNQLTQVREQIEVIRGQINFYEESASYSAISVAVMAKIETKIAPVEVGGWQPISEARDALQALVSTMQVFGLVLIWLLVYVAPVLLIIFIPLRIIWWFVKRNSKGQSPQAPIAPPQAGV
jgi:hypothetical protein